MTPEEAEFARWRDSLPAIDVDGEHLFVIHGDRLVDEGQLRTEWAGLEGGRHGRPGDQDADCPEPPGET